MTRFIQMYNKSRHQRLASGASPPHLKSVTPFQTWSAVTAYIQYLF